MFQDKIDKWLYSKEEINSRKISDIFYIQWESKKPPKVYWLDTLPKCTIYKKIMWRECKKNITICGNIERNKRLNSKLNIYYKGIDTVELSIPLLKSNLQKCIRRKLTRCALITSYQLIENNLIEFLRRISIIMLEDCILHSSFSVIMWMISAYPEWVPDYRCRSWLFGVVYLLCEGKYREFYDKNSFSIFSNIREVNMMNNDYKNLLYSMELRKSYGGLKGDIGMISYLTNKWFDRFKNNRDVNKYLSVKIEMIKIKDNIEIDDIHLSSIDFHICSIVKRLKKEFNDISEDDLKNSMWYFRSGCNLRDKFPYSDDEKVINLNKYKSVWLRIEKRVKKISENYRYNYFDKSI